jgi:soluble lytic murein transglycosylase
LRSLAFTVAATLLIILAGGFYFLVRGSRPHRELVYKYSGVYHVDPLLSLAVIQVESGFNERAVSRKGAVGLMQLMPATAREEANDMRLPPALTPAALEEPGLNINLGIRHLSRLSREFKEDPVLTLAAYNAGPASVRMWLGGRRALGLPEIPYAETRHFVKKVLLLRWLFVAAEKLGFINEKEPG